MTRRARGGGDEVGAPSDGEIMQLRYYYGREYTGIPSTRELKRVAGVPNG